MARLLHLLTKLLTGDGISLLKHTLKSSALANAAGTIAEIAQNKGVKPNQIALAWLLHYSPNIILIPGTTAIAHLEENMAAGSINLAEAEINQLNLTPQSLIRL